MNIQERWEKKEQPGERTVGREGRKNSREEGETEQPGGKDGQLERREGPTPP